MKLTLSNLYKTTDDEIIAGAERILNLLNLERENKNPFVGPPRAKEKRFLKHPSRAHAIDLIIEALRAKISLGLTPEI